MTLQESRCKCGRVEEAVRDAVTVTVSVSVRPDAVGVTLGGAPI